MITNQVYSCSTVRERIVCSLHPSCMLHRCTIISNLEANHNIVTVSSSPPPDTSPVSSDHSHSATQSNRSQHEAVLLLACHPVVFEYGKRLICKVQRMRKLYTRSTINLCSRNSNNINHISQEFGHFPQINFFIFFDFTSFSKYEINCPCLVSTLFTFFAFGL